MQATLTNHTDAPRTVFNTKNKAVTLAVGETATGDFSDKIVAILLRDQKHGGKLLVKTEAAPQRMARPVALAPVSAAVLSGIGALVADVPNLAYTQLLSRGRKLLGPSALPGRPKKVEIIAALKARIGDESVDEDE